MSCLDFNAEFVIKLVKTCNIRMITSHVEQILVSLYLKLNIWSQYFGNYTFFKKNMTKVIFDRTCVEQCDLTSFVAKPSQGL